MNYRHAYHAGNFADVMKHAVLALILTHLKNKAKPFRVIDTHAGIGLYDLSADAPNRTGEWHDGIARLIAAADNNELGDLAPLLAPYLDAVAAVNDGDGLAHYPGSPALVRSLLRNDDRLIANELHPEDAELLRASVGRAQYFNDRRVKILSHDGWSILKSTLPPKERRGVVLIDPPFEQPGEFDRLVTALTDGARRFATGIYVLWYPLKDRRGVERFKQDLVATGLPKLLCAELMVRRPGTGEEEGKVLYGSGLIIHNPPYGLHNALAQLLPGLAAILAADGKGASSLVELRGELRISQD